MLSKHNRPIKSKLEYRQFEMANIPNEKVCEKIVSRVSVLNHKKSVVIFLFVEQIEILHFQSVLLYYGLCDAQRF